MRARDCRPPSRPRVDFQTQPVFDENDDDDGKAHPKIIGMTDSSGREGGKAYRRSLSLPSLTGQSAPLF